MAAIVTSHRADLPVRRRPSSFDFSYLADMHAFCLILLALGALLTADAAYADTLRHYDLTGQWRYMQYGDIFAERFRVDRPLFVRSITLRHARRGNVPSGVFDYRLRILGGNGGDVYPRDDDDLIEPIDLTWEALSEPIVTIPLPTPARVTDEQFFVAIEVSEGSKVSPVVLWWGHDALCADDTGELFYTSVWRNRHDTAWYSMSSPYWIDAAVEYLPAVSPGYVDATAALGLPRDLPARSIAWGDLSGDAASDLLVGERLFRGSEAGPFTEITSLLGPPAMPSVGTIFDADGDGDEDILLLKLGGGATLHRNDGNDRFTSVAVSIPTAPRPSSISVADFDGNGTLDLFIGQAHPIAGLPGGELILVANNGGLTFSDVTPLLGDVFCASGDVRGAIWTDVDDDGDPDLQVVDAINGNRIWRNDRLERGSRFVELSGDAGWIGATEGMLSGGDWGDFDNDGTLDPLLPRHGRQTTGVARNRIAAEKRFTSLAGAGLRREGRQSSGTWGDIDNDGRLDIFAAVDSRCRYAEIYRQRTAGSFTPSTFDLGLAHRSLGPDGTLADIDGDGRLDLACGEEGHFRLFRNVMTSSGTYVAIDLASPTGVVGARVSVRAGGLTHTREVHAGRGLLAQDPSRIHVGLGTAGRIEEIVVRWPAGTPKRERFSVDAINRTHSLLQGTGTTVD